MQFDFAQNRVAARLRERNDAFDAVEFDGQSKRALAFDMR
jgi:hypothetical protein